MTRTRSETTVKVRLLQVGLEIVPVYGDDKSGWSFDSGMATYRTLDELFFALVNMNLSSEGLA